MKKLVAVMIIICLLFAGFVSWRAWEKKSPAAQEEEFIQEILSGADTIQPESSELKVRTLNAEKLYALYAPETVVMTVNGKDVTWGEYFYFLNTAAQSVSSYILNMQAYGMDVDWDDMLTETENGLEYVTAYAEDVLHQLYTIETFAENNGVGISVENEQALAAETESTKLAVCGEGATEEDFDAWLAEQYMSRDFYDRMGRFNYLYQNGFTTLYGENGALISDEDAIAYLQENNYIYANHILYLTTDMSTGAELDAEAIESALAAAQHMSEYFAITEFESNEALVARFAELKAAECEDSGKTAYPNGYVFTTGEMVAEFEETAFALEEYQVSEPVKTSYGYHVLLRLPLDPDAVISYSEEGTPLTARAQLANQRYGQAMQELHDSISVVYAPEFEGFSIEAYLE